MKRQTVTPASELARLVEERRYRYFEFPVLGITVRYRKPDMLKLAFKNALPTMLADVVIRSYKEQLNGKSPEDVASDVRAENPSLDDENLKEVAAKGYTLLSELVISHKILDVPQTDAENDVLAWVDIPEEDAMGFLMHLIKEAQTGTTKGGGEISIDEITDFPDSEQVPKRNTASKRG